jgi:hypothetical protein
MMSYRWSLVIVVAALLAGGMSACSDSPATTKTSGVSCTNYAIHASGKYHDEVWVRVNVSNATAQPRHYAVEVALSVHNSQQEATAATNVTVSGLVAANTSAELGRKVLTTDVVQRCRITRLSRS